MRLLRARPAERGGGVMALALTAFARLEDAIRARSSGYQGHLAKPISPGDLAGAIATLQREGPTDASAPRRGSIGHGLPLRRRRTRCRGGWRRIEPMGHTLVPTQ